ncbi:MAG: helix-turn-helix domain-containing protein [Gaiellaceae bacterium]
MFEIGYSLRSARERQGLGFPEVESATKIRAKYIRAIEEDAFDSLPGDAYTRGFLRAYADYLGLDGEAYVEEYASRFLTSWRDELPQRPARRVRRRERGVERRAVVLALVGIAMLTALVFAAWRYGGKSPQVPALDTQQTQTGSTGSNLVLRGVGTGTYVVVRRNKAAGEVLLQGTVGRGEIERLTGRRFYLLVRSPANLRAKLAGRAIALLAVRNLRVLVTPQRTTRLTG